MNSKFLLKQRYLFLNKDEEEAVDLILNGKDDKQSDKTIMFYVLKVFAMSRGTMIRLRPNEYVNDEVKDH
jgi:hypothetical protein